MWESLQRTMCAPMRIAIACFVVAASAPGSCVFAAQSVPAPLLTKLQSLAASDAIDCGSVARGADRAAAIACARGAIDTGKPFKVAMQLEEPGAWQAAAR